MKKIWIIILAVMVSGALVSPASSQDRGVNGLIIGAGGGALLGQAIGRSTEGTLIGTAVGGMLGYIIGNEQDKQVVVRRTHTSVRVLPQPVPRRGSSWDDDKWENDEWDDYGTGRLQENRVCRETEVLGTINGRPRKLYGTACLRDGVWVMGKAAAPVDQTVIIQKNLYVYKDKHHRKHGRHWRRHHRHHNWTADAW